MTDKCVIPLEANREEYEGSKARERGELLPPATERQSG